MVSPNRSSISRDRIEKRRAEEQARLEGKAQADAEAKKVAEKTARLRAARLAMEAANKAATDSPVIGGAEIQTAKRPSAKRRKGKRK